MVLRLFSVLAEYSVILELETEGAAGLQIKAVSSMIGKIMILKQFFSLKKEIEAFGEV